MRTTYRRVCGILAHHLHCNPTDIRTWHRWDEDLDLTPLELVLVALEIEELEAIGFSLDGLEETRTVAELVQFFSRAVADARRRAALDEVA